MGAMWYKVFSGLESDIRDLLNGAVNTGPLNSVGIAVGGLTLIFTVPAVTITLSGTLGSTRTPAQIVADILGGSDVVAEARYAAGVPGTTTRDCRITLWRSGGFTLAKTGTANALLGLSTSAATVSTPFDPAKIVALSQGTLEGKLVVIVQKD